MRRVDPFVTAVTMVTVLYVALALSPSSYSVVLHLLDVPDKGTWLFDPQPIRSDEWALWTPHLQIVLNNGFERFNATSPYGEDLRNLNGLPLWDWALLFKPQFWPFFVVDPAYAYSFSHAAIMAAFVIGYHLLFQALGFARLWAAALSLLLYFTSASQFWWTTIGPVIGIFPWLLLVALWRFNPVLKALAMAWVATAWFMAMLYPPIMVSLAFVGVVLLAAFRRDALRLGNLLACGIGAAVAVGLTYLYLAEAFAAMLQTIYPGQRISAGGDVGMAQWLSHFFPFLVVWLDESLLAGVNVCEVSTGGSWLPLLALVFVNHRALAERLRAPGTAGQEARLTVFVPLGAALLVSAWMILPLPSWAGMPLLWDRVPPVRMTFALGLLLTVCAAAVLRAAPACLSWPRLLAAAVLCVVAWAASEALVAGREQPRWSFALVLLPLLGLLAWAAPRLHGQLAAAGVLCVAASANLLGFGWFNPVQSAKPIFHRPPTALTATLDKHQAEHPQGWLVTTALPGAVQNGLGYRSISHILVRPQLDFFRPRFPGMDDAAFNQVFNRFAHIHATDEVEVPITTQADVIKVPAFAFGAPRLRAPALSLVPALEGAPQTGGVVDAVVPGNPVVIRGWGLFAGDADGRRLSLSTSAAVASATVHPVRRPDVAAALGDHRLGESGFEIRLTLKEAGALPDLCLASDDPAYGSRLLALPAGGPACTAAGP